VLGKFADRHLAAMTLAELDQFERFLAEEDPDIWNWVTGRDPLPEDQDNELTRRLLASCGVPDQERQV
jgi:antitoxin CptB